MTISNRRYIDDSRQYSLYLLRENKTDVNGILKYRKFGFDART